MRSSENRFSSSLRKIKLTEIDTEPFKNRYSLSNIDELALSIKQQGLLVPLIVRGKGKGKYDLVSGHRRLSAIRRLGWQHVDCVTVDGSDDKMSQFAIVENIQREDLSDYEKAATFRVLHEKYDMTYSSIGNAVGKSKQYVSNHIAMLSLLDGLSDDEQRKVISLLLSLTEHHVRVILRAKEPKRRLALAKIAVENNLNVRQLERMVDQQKIFLAKGISSTPVSTSPRRTRGKFIIAVEGSSEKTTCRVYERQTNKTMGEYSFGPSNHHIMGAHHTALTIADGVKESMNYAGVSVEDVDYIVVCLASIHTPHDMTMLMKALAKVDMFGIVFVDRYAAALISSLGDKPGIIVKTDYGGSAVLGRNSKGEHSKAGGWGYMIDPSGSAYGIGSEALRNLSQRFDDSSHSSRLSDYIAKYLNVKNYRQLHELVYAKTMSMIQIAKMSEAVLASAGEGDTDAQKILVDTAYDLERLFFIVLNKVSRNVSTPFDVVLSGPIVRENCLVYSSLKQRLEKDRRVKQVRFENCDVLTGAFDIVSHSEHSNYRNQILTHISSISI